MLLVSSFTIPAAAEAQSQSWRALGLGRPKRVYEGQPQEKEQRASLKLEGSMVASCRGQRGGQRNLAEGWAKCEMRQITWVEGLRAAAGKTIRSKCGEVAPFTYITIG